MEGGRGLMEACAVATMRKEYKPLCPEILLDPICPKTISETVIPVEQSVQAYFPHVSSQPVVVCEKNNTGDFSSSIKNVGILLSGGPAPGGHNVLCGAFDALKSYAKEGNLYGFIDGFTGLLKKEYRILTQEIVDEIMNTGGFDALGTSRGGLRGKEALEAAVLSIKELSLDAVIIIGGDDSNTDAAFLAQAVSEAALSTSIIGVPKTIDGDLQSQDLMIPFGFDTACSVYAEEIGNIAKDLLSTKKYYFFIRLMGRSASHIALECALRTHPNICLISEEVYAQKLSMRDIVVQIANLVEERAFLGKHYGIILIPEGIIECFSDIRDMLLDVNKVLKTDLHGKIDAYESDAQRVVAIMEAVSENSRSCLEGLPPYLVEELLRKRDPHGNVHVSMIETERLLARLVKKEIETRSKALGRKIPFQTQTFFYGYEGRCGYPSNFDCDYGYSLGRLAVVLAINKHNGYITAIRNLDEEVSSWKCVGLPLLSLFHVEDKGFEKQAVIKKAVVDLTGPAFQSFAKARTVWATEDLYRQRGPMQFCHQKPFVLILSKKHSG